MAGHSHWKNIKRTKEADSLKRSLCFAKIGKTISILAKEGGGDLNQNPQLRLMVEKARDMNIPKENIERAIKKGTGELKDGKILESFIFEAYGPEGFAFIVEGITDSKNRIVAEFKNILTKFDGKMAETGSVQWMFERKGQVLMESEFLEEIELYAIEVGAEDVFYRGGFFFFLFSVEKTDKAKEKINEKFLKKTESSLIWRPKNTVEISNESLIKAEKMFEEIDAKEDVQEIYSNLKT